jgi:ABC-2 type transport system ATP-binding protein
VPGACWRESDIAQTVQDGGYESMMPASSGPVVAVSGVLFEYPGVRALDDVSIDIERGSVTALVGPNGAGKTTLLRCIAGLERPMLGSISVAGVDVLEEPRESHRKMGYLSDFYGLYDTLTVRQNLIYAAAAQRVGENAIGALVEQTAERLGLSDRLEVKSAALSRGQRQRVAIGQALVHQPEVLILDEPASGLDPEARHNLAQLFLTLQREGMTLIVSSHILAELDEYCSHMLVMQQGRIIENKALATAIARVERIRIAFDAPLADCAARLAGIDGVEVLESGAHDALVSVAAGPQAASALLRKLVEADLPVASFAPERQNLAQSYLKTVQAAKREPR